MSADENIFAFLDKPIDENGLADVTDESVAKIEQRVTSFAAEWSAERADAGLANRLSELRQRFTLAGVDSTPQQAIAQHRDQFFAEFDRSALRAAIGIETDTDLAIKQLDQRIAAKKALTPYLEPLGTQQARQTEELIEHSTHDRFWERCTRMTRAEALRTYAAADEQKQADRRWVAWLERNWTDAPLKADGASDALTLIQFEKAREARQVKRVPQELFAWRDRLERATKHLAFNTLKGHLRSGRPIAQRPLAMVK